MRQFLADASHELRTPLTSIRGYAELEGMRQRRTGNSTTNDALARIEAEGNRMARLVEDLLTLARGDQDRPIATERVDLSSLSSDAVDLTRVAYPERDMQAIVEPGLATLGDDAALLRAVRNVLGNAAIHTNQAGSIRLNAYRDQNQAVISIADGGPGMTPKQAQHAFERFWRADDSRVRATGGSGLGLTIVESIVTAHAGTLELQTSVATGTTITIRLPLTTRPESA